MATFDIQELVARAHFDYVGPMFPEWWARNKKTFLPSLKSIGMITPGQKYFTRLTLAYQGNQMSFPNEPLVSFSLAKTIIETPTVGEYRRGAVLEYICTENYQISIRGLCVDLDNQDTYPSDQVEEIIKMFDINDSLEVVNNPFFELFGIRKIALKDIQWDEMRGVQGAQRFIISAVSDQDFYADLKERDQAKLLQ